MWSYLVMLCRKLGEISHTTSYLIENTNVSCALYLTWLLSPKASVLLHAASMSDYCFFWLCHLHIILGVYY